MRFPAAIGLLVALVLALLPTTSGQASSHAYEIWTGNQGNNLVAIIHPGTWHVDATIDVTTGGYPGGSNPHMISFSPSGKYAYVANVGAGANRNNVTIIRTSDRRIVTQVQTAASAHAAAPSHDGRRVWVFNTAVNLITELMADEANEKWEIARTIPLAVRPICGVFTPDNSHVYVTLGGNPDNLGAIAILNTASGEVVRRIETGREGCGTVLSRDRSRLYVNVGWHARNPAELNDLWYAFNPRTHAQTGGGQLTGIRDSHGIGETMDGRELWIVNRLSNTLTVLDTATWTPRIIGVGDRPDILDFSPDGRYAFWAQRGEPQTGDPFALRGTQPGVQVFDVATKQPVAFIPIAGDPHGVAVRAISAPATPAVPAALPRTGDPVSLLVAALGGLLAALTGYTLRRAAARR